MSHDRTFGGTRVSRERHLADTYRIYIVHVQRFVVVTWARRPCAVDTGARRRDARAASNGWNCDAWREWAIESTTDASARRVDAEVDSVEGTAPRERASERANEGTKEGRNARRTDSWCAIGRIGRGTIGSTSTSNRPTRASSERVS